MDRRTATLSLLVLLSGACTKPTSTPVAKVGPPIELPGGTTYQVLATGSGDVARAKDKVVVHYVGTLLDGSEFDNSVKRGHPLIFRLGEGYVIKGWDEAIIGMREGEKRRLVIPPEQAYGAKGMGQAIPPYSTLLFDIELVEVR